MTLDRTELLRLGLTPAGRRKIVRQGSRFLIYLSEEFKELWADLHKKGIKVEVYIKPIEESNEGIKEADD